VIYLFTPPHVTIDHVRPQNVRPQATDRWTMLIKIVKELACDLFKCLCIGTCIANIHPRDEMKRGYVVAGYNSHRVKQKLSTVCRIEVCNI